MEHGGETVKAVIIEVTNICMFVEVVDNNDDTFQVGFAFSAGGQYKLSVCLGLTPLYMSSQLS